jgi:hypothetical protein
LPRRTRIAAPLATIEDIRARIKPFLVSPLEFIAKEIERQTAFLSTAECDQSLKDEILKVFGSQIETVFNLLPTTFGDRFGFDAQLLDAIACSWNQETQRLSGTILPKANIEWSHGSAFIPLGAGNEQRKSVNVISVPGKDELNEIDLLQYPWMCHELAHNLFYYNDSFFVNTFTPKLTQVLNALRLRGIADHGSARAKSQAVINKIAEFWTPTLNHKNWAHEMAMDIVALWVCGPAFLAAFEDEIEDQGRDPYLLNKAHPPYALRTIALLRASKALGWSRYTKGMRTILENWRKSKWAKHADNTYRALCEPQLTEAVVDCALATCEHFSLSLCTEASLKRIEKMLKQDGVSEFGIDLIIAAWLVREQKDEVSYDQWQTNTIHSLSESISS